MINDLLQVAGLLYPTAGK